MWNISTSILRTKHPDFFSRQNVKPSQPRGVCDCRRRFCFARNMKSPPEIRTRGPFQPDALQPLPLFQEQRRPGCSGICSGAAKKRSVPSAVRDRRTRSDRRFEGRHAQRVFLHPFFQAAGRDYAGPVPEAGPLPLRITAAVVCEI